MIDKVLVLTLERCFERQQAWLGASRMRDIPEDIITFVQAHDNNGVVELSDIAELASADGFEFVEEYALGTVTEYVQQTPASVCQIWNISRVLRHISENNETCLFLFDDHMLLNTPKRT